jgi:hypothetical protein
LHAEGHSPINSRVSELPLILETAMPIHSLESSDPHYEIIDKSLRNFNEASIHIIDPCLIDDEILFGTLNIISVEDNLAEVSISNHDICL